MVLPPSTVPAAEPENADQDRVVNPWTTDSLAGAIVTALRNRNLAQQVEEEGMQGEWEVGLDLQFRSVIDIEVTSPTEHEAQAVVERLLQAVAHEVEVQQEPYDITEGERVTTVVLGAGENVDIVRGNQARALVVVFAAGMIATMGLTIGVDAWSRRRIARTASATGSPAAADPAPTSDPPATTNGARPEPAYAGAGQRADSAAQQPGISVSYRSASSTSDRSASDRPVMESAPADGAPPKKTDDATIVLPLSGASPGHQPGSRSGRVYPQRPSADGSESYRTNQR